MIYLIVIILILLSGLFSGLTLGLLGLNKTDLETKIKAGNKQAKKIYSVRKEGNLLLCTLLIGNVGVNSAIAILLGNIASGVVAGFVATGLIVIFGEIIPQSLFSRYALAIGSKVVWLVRILIIIFYPICFPIAWILDKTLGEEMPTIWKREELIEIIKLHKDSPDSSVDEDEKRIVIGALTFSKKTANEVMTPPNKIFSLNIDDVLDKKTLNKIIKNGFTRMPVFDKKNRKPIGLLYVKDLIGLNGNKKIKDIYTKEKLLIFKENKTLDEILNRFIREKKHLGFVVNRFGTFLGIITLEDVIEEIIEKEIIDETDKYTKSKKKTKKRKVIKRRKK